METRPHSILTDIDGTLVKYDYDVAVGNSDDAVLLPGAKQKMDEWWNKGYDIILTTGRNERLRARTERQLARLGLRYHQLVMGLTGGVRVLINDTKPDGTITAKAYSIDRNSGPAQLSDV